MALDTSGGIPETYNKLANPKPFDSKAAKAALGEKNDMAALFVLLSDNGWITGNDPNTLHPDAQALLSDAGLTDDFTTFLGVQSGAITANPELLEYLQKTATEDIDFSKIHSLGFDALKRIEYADSGLIVKVQTALEEQGLYVTDSNHAFHRDGQIGQEHASITWFGIRNAAQNEPTLANETIASIATTNSLQQHDNLRTAISLNRANNTIHTVGNQFAPEHAQALMETADQSTIGRGAMRLLNNALPEETLDTWAEGNEHAQSTLEAARSSPQFAFNNTSAPTNYDPNVEWMRVPDYAWPVLNLIVHAESKGDPNIMFSETPGNTRYSLVDMTIAEVRGARVDRRSDAAGLYQIISNPTADTLMGVQNMMRNQFGIPIAESNRLKFSSETQHFAGYLLANGRGLTDYIEGRVSEKEFAHALSKEWASFGDPYKGGRSHYAGDGLNKAYVSVEQVITAARQAKDIYNKQPDPTIGIAQNTPAPAAAAKPS